MNFRARTAPLVIVLLAAFAAGCGGGGGGDEPKQTKAEKAKAAEAKAAKAREGYFDKRESEALNPVIAAYNKDLETFNAGIDACNDKVQKLFDQDKPPAVQAKCHIDEATLMVDAVSEIRKVSLGFQREYRTECDSQHAKFNAFLLSYENAWKKVRSNWIAYGKGDRSHDDEVGPDVTKASKLANEFVDTQIPAMSTMCYTEADVDEAAKLNADAEKDAKDEAKDAKDKG